MHAEWNFATLATELASMDGSPLINKTDSWQNVLKDAACCGRKSSVLSAALLLATSWTQVKCQKTCPLSSRPRP